MNTPSRRHFLRQTAAVSAGFVGLDRFLSNSAQAQDIAKYGQLVVDPKGIIDLPQGFEYRVISTMGDPMDDGYKVPGQHDGMGTLAITGPWQKA